MVGANLTARLLASPAGRQLLEHDTVLAVEKDPDTQVIQWINGRAAAFIGASPRSLVGRSLHELFPRRDMARVQAIDRLVARTGRPVLDMTLKLTRDGTTTWFRADRWFVDPGRILVVQDELPEAAGEESGAAASRCESCGEPFEVRRRWQRYCTPACRQVAFWQRQHTRQLLAGRKRAGPLPRYPKSG